MASDAVDTADSLNLQLMSGTVSDRGAGTWDPRNHVNTPAKYGCS